MRTKKWMLHKYDLLDLLNGGDENLNDTKIFLS